MECDFLLSKLRGYYYTIYPCACSCLVWRFLYVQTTFYINRVVKCSHNQLQSPWSNRSVYRGVIKRGRQMAGLEENRGGRESYCFTQPNSWPVKSNSQNVCLSVCQSVCQPPSVLWVLWVLWGVLWAHVFLSLSLFIRNKIFLLTLTALPKSYRGFPQPLNISLQPTVANIDKRVTPKSSRPTPCGSLGHTQ